MKHRFYDDGDGIDAEGLTFHVKRWRICVEFVMCQRTAEKQSSLRSRL